MTLVVVVSVVVGGLLYMGSGRAHVWYKKILKQNPLFYLFFIMYYFDAHVWSRKTSLDIRTVFARERGVTPCSIIVV